jgi:hypothetical protein
MTLQELQKQALQLPVSDRSKLSHLMISFSMSIQNDN